MTLNDLLCRAGWLPEGSGPDVDLPPGCDLLPFIRQRWQVRLAGARVEARRPAFVRWLNDDRRAAAALTWGWPDARAASASRLLWWPAGLNTGRCIGVLSSRLGRRFERHVAWFAALRSVCQGLDPLRDLLLTCASTTADRFLRHCGQRLGVRVVCMQPPACGQQAADWLHQVWQRRPGGARRRGEWPVVVSPHIARDGDPLSTPAPASDWLVGCYAAALYVLHLRADGQLRQMLPALLYQRHPKRRVYVALGPGLVPARLAENLLDAGAVGWHPRCDLRQDPSEHADSAHRAAKCKADAAPMVDLPTAGDGRYLVHWTRRQAGPWPDQSEADYLDEILFETRRADRSALASLIRILTMQRIIATRRLTRGSIGVVCLTERTCSELGRYRTFRAHQQRWDFEPFGICLDRQWLEQRGARPVIYGDDGTWQSLPPEQRPFFQMHATRATHGSRPIDWTAEREWRHIGDVDLRQLPVAAGLVFVPTLTAAHEVAAVSRWPVTVLS